MADGEPSVRELLGSLPLLLSWPGQEKQGPPRSAHADQLRDAGYDAAAYAKILATGKPKLPLRILGDYDQVGKSLRLISAKKKSARILLPQLARAGKLQFKGSLSWHPLGSQQADLYLGYRRGLQSSEFIKLAVLPKRVALFWYRSSTWIPELTKDYDQALDVGSAKERSWHRFSVELDAKARTLDLSLGEDRKASFKLPGSLDLAGTRVGLGVYDGIAWFKELTVR